MSSLQQQARRFLAAEHQIHVLDGLAGGALHQIVDGADDDGTAGGGVELESDVAEVGAIDGGQVGQAAGLIEAHEFLGFGNGGGRCRGGPRRT